MVIPWLLFVASAAPIIEAATGLAKTVRQMLGKGGEASSPAALDLQNRIAVLEETERKQADVVIAIAQQLGQHAEALAALHAEFETRAAAITAIQTQVNTQNAAMNALGKQTRLLTIGVGGAVLLALSALGVALMRG